jgi:hypothetical protein
MTIRRMRQLLDEMRPLLDNVTGAERERHQATFDALSDLVDNAEEDERRLDARDREIADLQDRTAKVEENQLRRMAARRGLRLVKSRRRDPRASDYGTWVVVDHNNIVVGGPGMSTEEVREFLREDPLVMHP